jgi:hypothetical protein
MIDKTVIVTGASSGLGAHIPGGWWAKGLESWRRHAGWIVSPGWPTRCTRHRAPVW